MPGFFRRKKVVEFKSPVFGKAVELTTVPDEVFATKMVGDGIAFEPSEGVVYSPVSGIIVNIFPTKHAMVIRTREGLEVIIHIGIDTACLKGDGFESLVKEGQPVRTGDKIITFNMHLINEKAKSIIIPVILTNMERVESIVFTYGKVNTGTTVMKVKMK
jgi:sugar PTS system EIIA component